MMENKDHLDAALLAKEWESNPRWKDTKRNYSAEDVVSLRNSIHVEYSLSQYGSTNLWNLLNRKKEWISALGALSGNCLLYTSPSPRDQRGSRMASSA